MTGVKISALPAADAANDTDQLEVNQAGTSRRVTLGQVLESVAIPPVDWDDITDKPSTFPPDPELVDDRVAALLVAGANVTLSYNDAANSLTIASTGNGDFMADGSVPMTGPLTGTSATFTDQITSTTSLTGASTPALNVQQTWNNAATLFEAFKLNATDTASNSNSLLATFQTGGIGRFNFTKGGALSTTGSINTGASGFLYWQGRSIMTSPVDGQIRLTNNAQTDFSRLMLGGTTNAFPAIKRNATALNFRLADDSADAPITAGTITTNGFTVGYLDIPQNIQASTYQTVLADAGKHIYHAVAAAAATWTIPANGTVAYPIGTTLTFVNDSANNITIAITTDTLVLSPGTTTGSRTLAVGGVATAIKVTSTRWLISGTGLT